jgi:predicted dehydrogenase
MGQSHCRVYSNLRRVNLVGICDTDPSVGLVVAQKYEVPFYEQADELLDRVDAVSITTPTPTHFELAMRCLEKGVHILVEKPITETLEQAQLLIQAAEDNHLVVQVGHIERFNPVYHELKCVLEELTVLAVNMRRLSPYIGSNTDVDVVSELMIHDLDLVLDLIGQEPISINAQGLTTFSGVIDHAVAHLCFETGPLLTITASRVTEQKVRTVEVTAQEAYLEADLLNKTLLVHRHTIGEYINHNHQSVKYRQESIVECIQVPAAEPLHLQLQHFVDSILENTPPLVSARDGFKALQLATTIQKSIYPNLINIRVLAVNNQSTCPESSH